MEKQIFLKRSDALEIRPLSWTTLLCTSQEGTKANLAQRRLYVKNRNVCRAMTSSTNIYRDTNHKKSRAACRRHIVSVTRWFVVIRESADCGEWISNQCLILKYVRHNVDWKLLQMFLLALCNLDVLCLNDNGSDELVCRYHCAS